MAKKNNNSINKDLKAFLLIGLFFTFILFTPTFSAIDIDRVGAYTSLLSFNSKDNNSKVTYDVSRIINIGDKLASILEFSEVVDEVRVSNYSDFDIVNYFERALFYDSEKPGNYFDLDYIDLCNNNMVAGCVPVNILEYPSYNQAMYAISLSSLNSYSNLFFNRDLNVYAEFMYNNEGFIFSTYNGYFDNSIIFDSFDLDYKDGHYLVTYYGLQDNQEVSYYVYFDVVGVKDINVATFDNIKLISYGKNI